ncbi:DUF3099 domain-containing protein [Nesterenkonia suensis]
MNEQVHSITDAPQRHSEEQHGRMVRYAISMGIRIVCFVLAVVVQNWMTWVFLGLAVVLPYIAVTAANAGTDRYQRTREADDLDDVAALPSGAARLEEAAPRQDAEASAEGRSSEQDRGSEQIIEGEVVRDAGDDGRS